MPKDPKDNLRPPWKKGDPSPNPGGRPKIPDEIKQLRKLSKETYKKLGDILITGNLEELQAVHDDPNSTVVEAWVASAAIKGQKTGDYTMLDKLLDRLIGKVKEEIDISLPRPTIVRMKDGSELIMASKKDGEEDED